MKITFLPLSYKAEAKPGSNLFLLAREHGIDLGGICAGAKTCGKCKVLITKGNDRCFEKEEMLHLTGEERSKGYRLACCFSIKEDTCIILSSAGHNGNFSDSKHKTSNTTYEESEVQKEAKIAKEQSTHKNIGSRFGIALDLGTTTVVAELWNLSEKRSLGRLTRLNPQRLYGGDVISRITYASQGKEHLQNLTKLVRQCCNELVKDLADIHGITTKGIDKVILAANTTMTHLFLGRSVDTLFKFPFQGGSYCGVKASSAEIGININPEGYIYVMPGIGGHVGGDTVGCILAKRLYQRKGISLLIDIGTNGELVLAKDGRLTACSTAAGPAFEGGALHQGMSALTGAITRVQITAEGTVLDYIGKEEGAVPVGICGSGAIEAIAELYLAGWLDETGRLQGSAGETNEFTLWENLQKKVVITQKDIREIQLAKGAIYAGVVLLLKNENITIEQIDHLFIAGAFGSTLDVVKAVRIGLLPKIEENKVQLLGNASLLGAGKVLLDDKERVIAEETSPLVKHLELAVMEEFQEEFIKAMSLPQL